jgi:hypothetical protein
MYVFSKVFQNIELTFGRKRAQILAFVRPKERKTASATGNIAEFDYFCRLKTK